MRCVGVGETRQAQSQNIVSADLGTAATDVVEAAAKRVAIRYGWSTIAAAASASSGLSSFTPLAVRSNAKIARYSSVERLPGSLGGMFADANANTSAAVLNCVLRSAPG